MYNRQQAQVHPLIDYIYEAVLCPEVIQEEWEGEFQEIADYQKVSIWEITDQGIRVYFGLGDNSEFLKYGKVYPSDLDVEGSQSEHVSDPFRDDISVKIQLKVHKIFLEHKVGNQL